MHKAFTTTFSNINPVNVYIFTRYLFKHLKIEALCPCICNRQTVYKKNSIQNVVKKIQKVAFLVFRPTAFCSLC